MTDETISRRTVLIVEDEDDIREMLAMFLEREGYRVTHARSGREALAAAKEERPDCILMDLLIPNVDGLDIIRIIRATTPAPLRDVPIVVISGLERLVWREKALAAGCNEFISKPIDPEGLIAVVKHYAEKDNSRNA